uniref:Protein kinase domain-containing protein n=1 Tax=Zea mays TaxID=4577 RepID=B6U6P6_MAIZE|nr:hypothetical protein [Zea mays]
MEKKPTILMNRYELGRTLGQGTFAKVYHGRNLASGESVAIKVISSKVEQPASAIVSKLEQIAETERFMVKKQDGLVKLQGSKQGRKVQLAIDAEIFEVTPAFHVVEVKKSAGDTLEYEMFCSKGLRPSLSDICWSSRSEENMAPSVVQPS